jgi:hypothetical protein
MTTFNLDFCKAINNNGGCFSFTHTGSTFLKITTGNVIDWGRAALNGGFMNVDGGTTLTVELHDFFSQQS